jgi:hypothetical protein
MLRWLTVVYALDTPSREELQRAVEPDSLLPGEDLESTRFEDALHWHRVYGELLAVRLALLTHTASVLRGVTDDAFRDANMHQRLLHVQVERCRTRMAYWAQRATELAAPMGQAADDARMGRVVEG